MATKPCRDCDAQVSLYSISVESLCPSCGAIAPALSTEELLKVARTEQAQYRALFIGSTLSFVFSIWLLWYYKIQYLF